MDSVEGIRAGSWEENREECCVCQAKLGKRHMNPRHHCRVCGMCVCNACSPNTIMLAGSKKPDRVCTPCIASAFDTEEGQATVRASRIERDLKKLQGKVEELSDSLQKLAGIDVPWEEVEGSNPAIAACTEAIEAVGGQLREAHERADAGAAAAAALEQRLEEARAKLGVLHERLRVLGGSPQQPGRQLRTLEEATAACEKAVADAEAERAGGGDRAPPAALGASLVSAGTDTLHADSFGGSFEGEGREESCSVCQKKVGKRHLNPRHHCRTCGRCVCGACSPSNVQLEGHKGLQRVCTPCVNASLHVVDGPGRAGDAAAGLAPATANINEEEQARLELAEYMKSSQAEKAASYVPAESPLPSDDERVNLKESNVSLEGLVDTKNCELCNNRLGKRFGRPRHHCRICSRCVCSTCSPSSVQMEGQKGAQRVCTSCTSGLEKMQSYTGRLARASEQLEGAVRGSDGEDSPLMVSQPEDLEEAIGDCEDAVADAAARLGELMQQNRDLETKVKLRGAGGARTAALTGPGPPDDAAKPSGRFFGACCAAVGIGKKR